MGPLVLASDPGSGLPIHRKTGEDQIRSITLVLLTLRRIADASLAISASCCPNDSCVEGGREFEPIPPPSFLKPAEELNLAENPFFDGLINLP